MKSSSDSVNKITKSQIKLTIINAIELTEEESAGSTRKSNNLPLGLVSLKREKPQQRNFRFNYESFSLSRPCKQIKTFFVQPEQSRRRRLTASFLI